MKSNKLSQAEKILISASELSKSKKIFSAEDLTVKSWELYQDDFSLRGYQQFPNSNQIYTFLMNKNGPMYKNGWIRKVGEKQYKITDTAENYILEELKSKRSEKKEMRANLSRNIYEKVKKFLEDDIAKKILKFQNVENTTFDQICYFWGITSRVNGPVLTEKLEQIKTWISILEKDFKKDTKYLNIDESLTIDKKQLKNLKKNQEFFETKFKKEIDYIKKERSGIARKKI